MLSYYELQACVVLSAMAHRRVPELVMMLAELANVDIFFNFFLLFNTFSVLTYLLLTPEMILCSKILSIISRALVITKEYFRHCSLPAKLSSRQCGLTLSIYGSLLTI